MTGSASASGKAQTTSVSTARDERQPIVLTSSAEPPWQLAGARLTVRLCAVIVMITLALILSYTPTG